MKFKKFKLKIIKKIIYRTKTNDKKTLNKAPIPLKYINKYR